MSKIVVFTDSGYPVLERPGMPENHVLFPDDRPLALDDGRVLAPDGSYRFHLLNQVCFGGADGRSPASVPDDLSLIGKSWDELAAIKSDEHPYGLLREPRPATPTERSARERAEADAAAADEKSRIMSLSASSVQFAHACAISSIITREEAIAWAASGALPSVLAAAIASIPNDADRFAAEIKAAGAVSYERASPLVIGLGAALGKTESDLDALFLLAVTL